jgi:hypothetical protein
LYDKLENIFVEVEPFLLLIGSIEDWKSAIKGLEGLD